MKRENKIAIVIVLVLVALFSLFSCDFVQKNDDEVIVTSLSVVESTIPQNAVAGKVDVTQIRLSVVFSNGDTGEVTLSEDMLSSDSLAKLSIEGTHIITAVYQNKSVKFQIKVVNAETVYHTLRIYNALPIYINGEKVLKKLSLTGNYYENIYPDGTEVTFEWINDGNIFSYWTVNELPSSTVSTITVVMDDDYVYRPYTTSYINTVSFETFCDTLVSSKSTNILLASDIPSVQKANYVFIGWTMQASETGEYDDNVELVSFPYEVGRNVTFYAVWKSLGLSYTFVNDHYEVTKFNGDFEELAIPSHYLGYAVTTIRQEAFTGENCKKLKKLVLSSSIKEIGDGAFRSCCWLAEFSVDQDSFYYSSVDGVLYSADKTELIAYPADKPVDTFVVPAGVVQINKQAFFDALVGAVELPRTLERIGQEAFCSVHIDHIDFYNVAPSTLTLGYDIFHKNINSVVLSKSNEEMFLSSFDQIRCRKEKVVTDKQDAQLVKLIRYVEKDGQEISVLLRLVNNKNLTENVINGRYYSAEVIGCTRTVTTIAVPIRLTVGTTSYDVTSISNNAFSECFDLNNVVFSMSGKLVRICDGAFDNTLWLKSIKNNTIQANGILYKYLGNDVTYVMSNSVSVIAEGAFENNTTLRYVDIGTNSGLIKIAPFAFCNCTSLRGFICDANPSGDGLYLKYAVEFIGEYAFYNTAVTAVRLQPSNEQQNNLLSTIGQYAFAGCSYLKSMDLAINTVNIDSTSFEGTISLQEFVLVENNAYFRVFDGILYRYSGDTYTLFCYPADRLDGEFTPNIVRNYASDITVNYSSLKNSDTITATKIGNAIFNGIKHDLYISVLTEDDWEVSYDIQTEKYSLIRSGEKSVLEPARSYKQNLDGAVTAIDGDYYFSVLSPENNKTLIPIMYDDEKDAFYYYPTHTYFVNSITVDLASYIDSGREEVGTARLSDIAYSVYLQVLGGKTISFGSTATPDIPTDSVTKKDLKTTTKVLYNDDGSIQSVDGEFYYYIYLTADKDRRIVLTYDSASGTYSFVHNINVTKIEKGAFSYSNIDALVVPSTVLEIEDRSLCIPGLSYLKFDRNPLSTYKDIFDTYEPNSVLVSENLGANTLLSFFNNITTLKEEKAIFTRPYVYFYNHMAQYGEKTILYAYELDSGNIDVVRASRGVDEIIIDETVSREVDDGNIIVYNSMKHILEYAFYGVYLEKVTLRSISSMASYSFYGATNLTKLVVETTFVSDIGDCVFGDKLNNGLYIYDLQNGINLYSESDWGLEFFTYLDQEGIPCKASKYLILTGAPFAVIVYKDEEGMENTFEVYYDKITKENVESIQSSVQKEGYAISGWTQENGTFVKFDKSTDYSVPYNQILTCSWTAKQYTVYMVVNAEYASTFPISSDYQKIEWNTSDEVGKTVTYSATVTYGKEYEFEMISYDKARYIFDSWQDISSNSFAVSGIWNSDISDGSIYLYPVMKDRVYTLEYNPGKVSERLTAEVLFGESYEIAVPVQSGKTFKYWYIFMKNGTSEEKVILTDNEGKSLLKWNYSSENKYTLFAEWEENDDE